MSPTASVLPATPADLPNNVHRMDEAIINFNQKIYKPNGKAPEAFRNYSDTSPDRVAKFYAEQHQKQTVDFNRAVRERFLKFNNAKMSIWQALELLNELQDSSDPDTEMSQIQHCLQTAEAIRKDGLPRWFQLTGLVHDLGKLLAFFGAQGQWEVVGDTFIVGCKFSDKCVFPESFKLNPDYNNPEYNTEYGIYKPHCGLDNVIFTWGHDEYMYEICRQQSTLPEEGLYMIRYHSAYPVHREGAYQHLLNDKDHEMLEWVRRFNPYDLYTKSDDPPKVEELKPYYQELIAEFFPSEVNF